MVRRGLGDAIEGMESIVAAVSGYHGAERFKLIKLISLAGANYVGTMSRSTTHLFCWKFEGKKYDLAKKLGTIIVNHQWLEDCMKARKHVSEHLYASLSGYEVEPITIELPVVSRGSLAHFENDLPFVKSNGSTCVIDLDGYETEDGFHHRDLLFDENLFSQPRQSRNARCRTRSRKKVVDDLLNLDVTENSSSMILPSRRSVLRKFQHEELTSDTSKSPVRQRRIDSHERKCTSSAETSRRKRRLVKKNTERNLIDTDDSDADIECCSLRTELRNIVRRSSETDHHDNSNHESEANICSISDYASVEHGGIGNEEVMEVEAVYDRKGINGHDSFLYGEQSTIAGDESLPSIVCDIEKLKGKLEEKDTDCSARLSPVEVSCAICWTDYSSTRGILQCGHRFCFSCIQRWADRSASSGKQTRCPMCAANFSSIVKVDGAACLDQKIYSQTVPCHSFANDVFIVPDGEPHHFLSQTSLEAVCYQCQSREPEDLLMPCRFCQIQCVHSYCLDPPLFPWICNGCRDLQIFRNHI